MPVPRHPTSEPGDCQQCSIWSLGMPTSQGLRAGYFQLFASARNFTYLLCIYLNLWKTYVPSVDYLTITMENHNFEWEISLFRLGHFPVRYVCLPEGSHCIVHGKTSSSPLFSVSKSSQSSSPGVGQWLSPEDFARLCHCSLRPQGCSQGFHWNCRNGCLFWQVLLTKVVTLPRSSRSTIGIHWICHDLSRDSSEYI